MGIIGMMKELEKKKFLFFFCAATKCCVCFLVPIQGRTTIFPFILVEKKRPFFFNMKKVEISPWGSIFYPKIRCEKMRKTRRLFWTLGQSELESLHDHHHHAYNRNSWAIKGAIKGSSDLSFFFFLKMFHSTRNNEQ